MWVWKKRRGVVIKLKFDTDWRKEKGNSLKKIHTDSSFVCLTKVECLVG